MAFNFNVFPENAGKRFEWSWSMISTVDEGPLEGEMIELIEIGENKVEAAVEVKSPGKIA